MKKRDDYISWDEYFMSLALLSAKRSKDPNTQVGACIVDKNNKILSVGYNGAPVGFNDDEMPWEREGGFKETKYAYICHAELNAILNFRGNTNLEDATIYVALFPCNECAKAIIQSGIKRVVYLDDKYGTTDSSIVAKKLLKSCGVECVKYEKKNKKIELDI